MRFLVVLALGLGACGDDGNVNPLPDAPLAPDSPVDASTACPVSFDDGTGAVDITATFAGGTAGAPVAYVPPSAGKLTVGPCTIFAHINATTNLEIAGTSAAMSIIDGGMLARVVTAGTAGTTVNIHDITLTHGMTDSGGAVVCVDSTLTITNATLSASTATNGGGAAFLVCNVNLTDVTVTGNSATNGGGILNQTGTTTLTRVTVSANVASGSGGGIASVNAGAQVNVVDSTITGNTSSQNLGGGIYTELAVACTNSAITANTGVGVHIAGNGATYSSTTCDYGTGAGTDNTPNDVRPSSSAPVNFGDDASFNCTDVVCL